MRSALHLTTSFLIVAIIVIGVLDSQAAESADTLQRGIEHYIGTNGRIDLPAAGDAFAEAAEEGDPLGQLWVARLQFMGRAGFALDRETAQEAAAAALPAAMERADTGDAHAAFLVGSSHQFGLGTERDLEKALSYYHQAAAAGDSLAMNNLAVFSARAAKAGADSQGALAEKWARKALAEGNQWATVVLAGLYEYGYGVDRDLQEAVAWYEKGAEAGLPSAAARFAQFLTEGEHVAQDLPRAAELFRQSAEAGEPEGMRGLAKALTLGRGVDRNLEAGVDWWKRLAKEAGDGQAARYVGLAYWLGEGVEQDPAKAETWLKRAVELGDPDAVAHLADLRTPGA